MSSDEQVDPRVKRTRRQLQQALIDLMATEAFHTITVGDIAKHAMVNRATFYAHFEDKYALLNATVREQFQEVVNCKLPAGAGFSTENLRLLILAACEFLAAFNNHCAPVTDPHQPPIQAQVQAHLYEVLLAWFAGMPQNGILPEATATTLSWGIFGSALQWSFTSRHLSAEQVTEQILPLVQHGLDAVISQV